MAGRYIVHTRSRHRRDVARNVSTPPPCRPFPLPSLTHARPILSPVSRRSVLSPRPTHLPRRDPPHTTFPRWFRIRSTIGYRYATANAVTSSPLPLSYHTALASHLDPTLPCGVTESCSLRELEPTPTCLTNSIRIFLFPLVDYFFKFRKL